MMSTTSTLRVPLYMSIILGKELWHFGLAPVGAGQRAKGRVDPFDVVAEEVQQRLQVSALESIVGGAQQVGIRVRAHFQFPFARAWVQAAPHGSTYRRELNRQPAENRPLS